MADIAPVVVPESPQKSYCGVDSTSSNDKNADEKISKKKKSTSLPAKTVEYLKAWMMSPEHVAHPYPTEQEKAQIMADTGIEMKQLTNWFVNNRKRYWKPRVEARLQQQAQAQAAAAALVGRRDTEMKNPSCTNNTLNQPLLSIDMAQHVSHQIMPPSLVGDSNGVPLSRHAFHHFNHDDNMAAPPVTLQHHQHTEATHAVSIGSASSLASDSDSGSFGGEEDNNSAPTVPPIVSMLNNNEELSSIPLTGRDEGKEFFTITQHEPIDVHVLRPSGEEPSLEDMTILTSVPPERIVKTYSDQEISYSVPQGTDTNTKEIQSLRDAEVVRVKKECLRRYLSEEQVCRQLIETESHGQNTVTKRARAVSDSECSEDDDSHSEDCCSSDELPTPKRVRTGGDSVERIPERSLPRSLLRKSPEDWRDACRNATHAYHESLPTLEEAAHLFGYAP